MMPLKRFYPKAWLEVYQNTRPCIAFNPSPQEAEAAGFELEAASLVYRVPGVFCW